MPPNDSILEGNDCLTYQLYSIKTSHKTKQNDKMKLCNSSRTISYSGKAFQKQNHHKILFENRGIHYLFSKRDTKIEGNRCIVILVKRFIAFETYSRGVLSIKATEG